MRKFFSKLMIFVVIVIMGVYNVSADLLDIQEVVNYYNNAAINKDYDISMNATLIETFNDNYYGHYRILYYHDTDVIAVAEYVFNENDGTIFYQNDYTDAFSSLRDRNIYDTTLRAVLEISGYSGKSLDVPLETNMAQLFSQYRLIPVDRYSFYEAAVEANESIILAENSEISEYFSTNRNYFTLFAIPMKDTYIRDLVATYGWDIPVETSPWSREILADAEGHRSNNAEYKLVQNTNLASLILPINLKLSNNQRYVTNIALSTTLNNLNITSNSGTISYFNHNDEPISDNSARVCTGMKIKISNREYELVVKGDTSGDGVLDASDLSKLIYHIAGVSNRMLEGPYSQAAYLNNDDRLDASDLAALISLIANGE